MITRSNIVVNAGMYGANGTFTLNDYYMIASCEYGTLEWNVLVEQAYFRLSNDLQIGLSAPLGVPEYWWDKKKLEWLPLESSGESVDSETLFGYNDLEVKDVSDATGIQRSNKDA